MTQERRRSYDYATRKGERWLFWEEFAVLGAQLAETLAARKIDTVVGVARGGLFPATLVAAALRCELFPVRLTRRLRDEGSTIRRSGTCPSRRSSKARLSP